MAAQPLVSVVIPTYNRAHLIGRTLDSVRAQTFGELEIVVVDDGSTDDTRARVEAIAAIDRRVRYVGKPNGGPASARNTGFRSARGDYVALIDSDDTWYPWKVALQVRCMERFPALGMTWTDMEMINPSGHVVEPRYLRHMYTAYRWFSDDDLFPQTFALAELAPDLAGVVGAARLRVGNLFSKMIMGNLVHTSTVMLRRERLERVRAFDESLRRSGEDYDFHLRTCREGPVALLDLPAIRYQQGMPDRLTAKHYNVDMAENLLKTLVPVIERDRALIDLPDAMIRRTLAKAHAWLAYERLERGEVAAARAHYLASLRQRPWQPEILKPLLFAAMPFDLGPPVRERLRAVKARLRALLQMPEPKSGGVGT
jgi:GT2 family glycosyltransferase